MACETQSTTRVRNRVVVVLGMHRSGTSAITRGLLALGVNLGERLMPALGENPRGYWEDLDVVDINESLLGLGGQAWHSLAEPDPSLLVSQAASSLRIEAMKLIRERVSACGTWGFKDPRTCKTLPFWQNVFRDSEVDDSYIIVMRNPRSVADSLRVRSRFRSEKTYLLWLSHMVPALRLTSGKSRVVIHYDRLLAQPTKELARAKTMLGLESSAPATALESFTTDFLDQSLRHSEWTTADVANDPSANDVVSELLSLLDLVVDGRILLESSEFAQRFETLSERYRLISSLFPYLDQIEKDSQASWVKKPLLRLPGLGKLWQLSARPKISSP